MLRYFIIYKPFQVLSQFTAEAGKKSLKDLFKVPSDVYPVGRLDYDSEGLLLLTNDKNINHQLLDPRYAHEREYWVQVEGIPSSEALGLLQSGITITIDGRPWTTKPAKIFPFREMPAVPERNPPVRFRQHIPTSWIKLILTEGKNRQVRKMTAKVGYPTLRLIRYRIGKITLGHLLPGEMLELDKTTVYQSIITVK